MDNTAVVAFRPDRRYTALAATGVVLAAGAAFAADDRPGRLLALLALVVLLAYAGCDLVFSPRLVASADGIVIRSPLLRARLGWDEVERVAADTRLRHGLRSTTLEVDAGDVLAVFSRRALGAEPDYVAAQVLAVRPG